MLGCGVLEESGVFGEDTLLFLYATSYVWLTDDPVFLCGVLCSYHNLVCVIYGLGGDVMPFSEPC